MESRTTVAVPLRFRLIISPLLIHVRLAAFEEGPAATGGRAELPAIFFPTGVQAMSEAAKTQTVRILVMLLNLQTSFLLSRNELAQLKLLDFFCAD
jgi:hypothetical protein